LDGAEGAGFAAGAAVVALGGEFFGADHGLGVVDRFVQPGLAVLVGLEWALVLDLGEAAVVVVAELDDLVL